ncbi:fatty-acid amide hydrolase 2 isoform X2 [Trichoplusia ni]|nr:fatty-acid amide hydrolase 2 isoform X2 [Trichoplusia ni]XP_026741570.1 fatty-acid amide hydrolase 2 isoform X2 [Trichoplusia ni]
MASNIFKHAIILFRMYIDWLIDLVFGFYWEGKRVKIPDLEKRHSILTESAVDIAAKIRNKQLKSEDLVKICIERIQQVNPIINAVTDERYEAALEEAREIDQKIAKGLPDEYFKKKPFLGVPFTAKESHAVAGLLHTLGVLARKDIRAHEDAECVRLMREAGAIPLAVTNVPEINKWMEARNYVFGQTNNPHHTGRTAGGSSGGEAALHAAVTVPISLCSDIGGSTRMPAFFNGLYALNPTPGHTSLKGSGLRTGEEPTMAAIGFSSRHPGDLAPLTKVVAGDKAHLLNLDRVVDIKKLKFYYVESSDDWRPSPICADQRNVMKKAIAKLTEDAVSTAHVPQPYYHSGFNYLFLLWRYWMTHEVEDFASMITNRKGRASFWKELAKKCVGMCDYTFPALMKLFDEQVVPPVNKEWAETTTRELKDALIELLGDDGVLLFPSCPLLASYHYAPILRPFNFGYWAIFNVLQFPAAQVPCGVNSDGIPLGVQVVAAPRHDALCTAVGASLGQALGGAQPPCRVH